MGSAKRIPVVDDDPDNLAVPAALVRSFGWAPECRRGGKEALDVLTRETDRELVDVMTPAMNGFEAAQRMCNHSDVGNVPIIIGAALTSVLVQGE